MSVLVVGGGLAGAAAALELASQDVKVHLVRRAPGATALSWGTLDVAAASPLRDGLPFRGGVSGRELTPAERLAFCLRTMPRHPYVSIFGASGSSVVEASAADAVKSAVSSLDGWLAPCGLRVQGGIEGARLLADVRGAVRVADLALTGPGDGDLRGAREIVLAELPGLAHFDPRPAAVRIATELAALGVAVPPIRVATLALPEALAALVREPARLAALLDDAETARAFASVVPRLAAEGLLLLPPVLGLARTGELLAGLRASAGVRVAELLGAPPFAPAGLRLDRALQAALARAGVDTIAGRVTSLATSAGRGASRVVAARVARAAASAGEEEARLPVSAVVLATGRFVGGGLVERDGRLVEPLLGLPLWDERDVRVDGTSPRRLLRASRDEAQSLLGAGVHVDGQLRPLEPGGRPAYDNVFAAGDLLGGSDPARDRTGLGVALLSGLRAGAAAARFLGAGASGQGSEP